MYGKIPFPRKIRDERPIGIRADGGGGQEKVSPAALHNGVDYDMIFRRHQQEHRRGVYAAFD